MNKLKEIIQESGYKQNFIAQKLGVHRTEISQWIAERRRPRNDQITEMSKLFGCKIKDLYPDYKLQQKGNYEILTNTNYNINISLLFYVHDRVLSRNIL